MWRREEKEWGFLVGVEGGKVEGRGEREGGGGGLYE